MSYPLNDEPISPNLYFIITIRRRPQNAPYASTKPFLAEFSKLVIVFSVNVYA